MSTICANSDIENKSSDHNDGGNTDEDDDNDDDDDDGENNAISCRRVLTCIFDKRRTERAKNDQKM